MKRLSTALSIAALVCAGLLTALAIAPPAKAWGPSDVPPGWQVHHEVSNAATCPEDYRIFEYTNGVFQDVSGPMCLDSPTYQQDFDAWIDARYTRPVTTTAPPPATNVTTTTTTAATTTVPASTEPAPPTPAPAPAPTTTTACDVQCQIADLQAQIVALRSELAQLVNILQTWPDIDPGILAQLMAIAP